MTRSRKYSQCRVVFHLVRQLFFDGAVIPGRRRRARPSPRRQRVVPCNDDIESAPAFSHEAGLPLKIKRSRKEPSHSGRKRSSVFWCFTSPHKEIVRRDARPPARPPCSLFWRSSRRQPAVHSLSCLLCPLARSLCSSMWLIPKKCGAISAL